MALSKRLICNMYGFAGVFSAGGIINALWPWQEVGYHV